MSRSRLVAVAALALCATGLAPVAEAAERGRKPVRSMLELRRDRVVQQGWDLSCGAAALSTLLTYDLGDPVAEGEIVGTLLQGKDADKIRERGGFTLLDLKKFATGRGHAASGYGNLTLATLAGMVPAIVPTLNRGEPHFMVLRKISGDLVHLADPAFGNRTLRRDHFERIWSPRVALSFARPAAGAAPVVAAGGAR